MPVQVLLLDTLDDLSTEDFKTFQWHLIAGKQIRKARLENKSRADTVSEMIEHFGEEGAVTEAAKILETMRQRSAVVELKKRYAAEGGQTDGPTSSSGAAAAGGPTMSAQHGSVIIAPNIGSSAGTVNITYNSK